MVKVNSLVKKGGVLILCKLFSRKHFLLSLSASGHTALWDLVSVSNSWVCILLESSQNWHKWVVGCSTGIGYIVVGFQAELGIYQSSDVIYSL